MSKIIFTIGKEQIFLNYTIPYSTKMKYNIVKAGIDLQELVLTTDIKILRRDCNG